MSPTTQTLNEMSGRHSGCMMWPGSNFPYNRNETQCTFTKPYDTETNWIEKVDIVMEWLTDPVKPVNLVMLYFDEPDYHGHVFSPDSDMVNDGDFSAVSLINHTHFLRRFVG